MLTCFQPLSLFKGVIPPAISVAAVNTILFGTYSLVSQLLGRSSDEELAIGEVALAGAVGGAAQLVVVTPLELVKIRAQLSKRPAKPLQTLAQIVRTQGLAAAYRGNVALGLRDVPTYALYFGAYEWLMRLNRRHNWLDSSGASFLAGGVGGTAAWACAYPMDFVKTRVQASDTLSLRSALSQLRNEPGAFRGLPITLGRAFIANAVTFCVYEKTLSLLA